MSAHNMKTVWILAWLGLAAQMMATETRNYEDNARDSDNKSEPQKGAGEAERSLKKRQLNFDGGGGGVNRYLNGDYGEYEDYDIEYWTQVTRKNYEHELLLPMGWKQIMRVMVMVKGE